MTIPVSAQWDVLSFTEGLNLFGPVPAPNAIGFFVSAAESGGLHGEGVDWSANPAAGWPARYCRDATDTIVVINPGAGAQEILMMTAWLNLAPHAVSRSWVEEAKIHLVTPVAGCYFTLRGNQAVTGSGTTFRANYDVASGLWALEVYNPGMGGLLSLGTYDLGLTVTLRILYDTDRKSVRLWANDIYITEFTSAIGGGLPLMSVSCFGNGSTWNILSWTISTHPGYGTTKPAANSGPDRVVPLDRNAGFDGKNSRVATGETPLYRWKLVGAPAGSSLVYSTGTQGSTIFNRWFQDASADFVTNCSIGDMLVLDGGFFEIVYILSPDIVQLVGYAPAYIGTWQVIKQTSAMVQGGSTRVLALDPPAIGLYMAQLDVMNDSGLLSDPDLAACNVVPAQVPLGVPLDMGFLWEYLSDFWRKVEGKDWAPAAWMGVARIAGAYLTELWNIDFDKSLATTQNVATRRWYPVFPRLDEPYPSRCIFHSLLAPALGSIRYTKAAITAGVTPGPDNDLTFQLDTEEGPKILAVTIPAGTAYSAVSGLVNTALAADDWFDCLSVSFRLTETHELDLSAGSAYRLVTSSSSYGFSVSDSTGEYYTGTVTSRFEHDATVTGTRTVLWNDYVDVDLLIKPGDVLNIGSRSYNITNVSHWVDPTLYRHLQLEVDEDLPVSLTTAPSCIPSYWTSTTVDWWDEGVTAGDDLWLERRPYGRPEAAADLVHVRVAGAGPKKICSDSPDVWWPFNYLINHAVRYFYVPVDEMVLSLPRLQEAPDAPEWVMEEYFHYLVDDRRDGRYVVLNFRDEPVDEISATLLYRDPAKVSFLPDYLWAEVALMDNRPIIEQVFGRMVKTYVEDFASSPDANYLSIITALWQAYSKGPEPDVLNRTAAILSGVPYAEAGGIIVAVGVDFYPGLSYMLIRDLVQSAIVRCYVFQTGLGIAVNPATGMAYAEGDQVVQFSLLVDTQIYYDYVAASEWFKALRASGSMREVEKVHKFGMFFDADYVDIALWSKVVDFILDIKKSNTYSFFVLLRRFETEIHIADEVGLSITLAFKDHLWDHAAPPILDYPRLGSGVRVKTQMTSVRNDAVLFRMATAGATGDETAPNTPWTMSFRAGAALGSSAAGHDLTLVFVRGVTTSGGVVAYWAGLGSPYDNLVAYLPDGSDGLGTINEEYGPVLTNHRGNYQVHFDDLSPQPVDDVVAFIQDFNTPGITVLSSSIGSNAIAGVTTNGFTHRVSITVPGPPQFHDGAIPAVTLVEPRRDWLVFYTAAGAYRTMGQIVGVDSPIVNPGFGQAFGLQWVDVQVDPALPSPQAGNSFVLMRGAPYTRVLDTTTYGESGGSILDTRLGYRYTDNTIASVLNTGPATYQVGVDPAAGSWFTNGGTTFSLLLPGEDYFVYYDAQGSLLGAGVLVSLDGIIGGFDCATFTLSPPTLDPLCAPVVGGGFYIIRRPVYTEMTPDFIRHLSAFGLKTDNLFLRHSVSV